MLMEMASLTMSRFINQRRNSFSDGGGGSGGGRAEEAVEGVRVILCFCRFSKPKL
ncbi:hypothetical protein Bca4012_056974 [Brassica carinata]